MYKNNISISLRNEMADLLKGFAVIFMILVHSFEQFLKTDYDNHTFKKLAYILGAIPAAPVFMIVMGYFLWFSKRSLNQLILRGIKLIFLGFTLNLMLNFNLIIKTFAGKLDVNIFHYLFGVDILFLAGLSTIILAPLKFIKNPKITTLIFFVLFLVVVSLEIKIQPNYNSMDYFLAYFFKITDWSYFPLIPWFIYPLFGFMWAQNKKLLKYFNPSLLWRIFLIIMFIIYVYISYDYLSNISNNLNVYYNHNLKFIFYSLFFISGYWLILKQLNYYLNKNSVVKFIRFLGNNVTIIYIIQWIIIGNLSTELFRSLDILYTLIIFTTVLLLSSLLTIYLSDKIKLLKL